MIPWEQVGLVLAALMGAGGPLAIWISARAINRAQGTGDQIDLRLSSIEKSLQFIADSGSNTTSRLNGHDREFESHRKMINAHDILLHEHTNRISNLERDTRIFFETGPMDDE